MKDPSVFITPDQFAAAYTRLYMPDVADVQQPVKRKQPKKNGKQQRSS